MKEQGIENPEDHVLTQYVLSSDVNRLPMPLDDDGFEQGILMLYPEDKLEQTGVIPQSGGVVGTVKAIFRAFGFAKPQEQVEAERPPSKAVANSKVRRGSLYK